MSDRHTPKAQTATATWVSRRISWWFRCFSALEKGLPAGDPRASAAKERLKAATETFREGQELWLRVLHRSAALTPRIQETNERIHRLEGEVSEESLEPPGAPGEDAGIVLVLGEASPCVGCGNEVGGGLLGWRLGAEPGPLCNDCLARSSPDLGALLALLARALHVGAERMEGNDDPGGGDRVLLELARRYARASAVWPPRPTRLLERAFELHQRMVERHGPFYHHELPLSGGTGGQEEN